MSKIQAAIVTAMADISRIGIGKTQENKAQGYHFRGVEQAMNEMSPILVNNGISVSSRYSDLTVNERVKGDPKDGKATRFVTIKGTFTFMADDDSSIVSEAYGEAMDSGDKAVIKAQSVAFRTALFQQFVVPTVAMDSELDDPPAEEPVKQPIGPERFAKALEAIKAKTTTAEYVLAKFTLSDDQAAQLDALRGGK